MSRMQLLLIGCLLALPLLGGAALLWRRHYRDEGNQARRIFKNSAVPLVLRLAVKALDLLVAMLLLSTIAPELFGAYVLAALFVVQYLGTISDFGLGVLLTREVARDQQQAPHLFAVTLLLRLLLVLACLPAAALLIGGYAVLGRLGIGAALSPLEQQAIWVLLLTLIPSAYSGAVTALFNANERMEVPALIELVTAIVSTVARIGVVVLGLGVLGLAWAAVASSLVTALIFLGLQLHSYFAPRLAWDRLLLRQIIPAAFPLMLNSLLVAVFFRFDLFLIRAFGGSSDQAAAYNVPYQVLNIALILPPVVVGAVFPLFARQAASDRAGLVRAQQRTLQVLLLLAFPLAMAMSVLAPALVSFFTRANAARYLAEGSAEVLAVTAWFLPFSFVNGLNQYVLIASERQATITRAFGYSAVFNLAANLLAIPLCGLIGASVVTILTEAVLYLIFEHALRAEGLRTPLLMLVWRPAIAALGLGVALRLLTSLDWAPAPTLLLATVLGTLVYGAGLWLLGALGAEERALVRRVLGRA